MFTFADSFDLYATMADPIAGYWDGGLGVNTSIHTLTAGRFIGSQAVRYLGNTTNSLTKSSGANDAVHHVVCGVRHNSALTGTFAGLFFTLFDGATAQCSVVFRTDGALLLTTGGPTGATLATYTGAVSSQTTWLAFEIEVVVNNTTGSFTVRKNGNTSNDFTQGSLNTRGGTANNYANKLTVGMQNFPATTTDLDDLLWRSDPTSVAWIGDIRSYTRMPATDASVQFARSLSAFAQPQSAAGGSTLVRSGNGGLMSAFTAAYSGTIASGTVGVNTGGTGNMKAAIYDSTRTIVLATSNAVVNPAAGNVAITFATPLTVTKGVTYHLAVDQDFIVSYNSTASTQWQFTTPYASFPTANPALLGGNQGVAFILNIATTLNADFVNETLQDGTASYVYDATVGHGDLYTIGAASPAPTSVVAVTTRGFIEKSDAGSRSGAVQVKSGATTVQSTSTPLSSSFAWLYRTDSTDPNTGSAWTPAAVDAMQIGPVVTA